MNLKDKLARLPPMPTGSASRPLSSTAAVPPSLPQSGDEPAEADDRTRRLRGMLDALISRQQASLRDGRGATPRSVPSLPGEVEETSEGPVRVRRRCFEPDHRHGKVPVAGAVRLEPELLAALGGSRNPQATGPERLLFLDTETTGLAGGTGTLAFLVGLGWFEDQSFVVEQLFLPRPGEERPMLLRLRDRLAQASMLVTFNGKSYDWPLMKSRFTMNRLDPPPVPAHLDLLTAARRVYRARLGGVRLVRLEEEVLGFRRERDIEGYEIPSLYWSYLRGEEAEDLPVVFEHNENDVVAMAALLAELHAALLAPRPSDEPSDHLGLARLAHRAADRDRALRFALRAAQGGTEARVSVPASLLAARLLTQAGELGRAESILRSAIELQPQPAPELHLALAKLYEHRLKAPTQALDHARRTGGAEAPEAHARRVMRLERRLRSG